MEKHNFRYSDQKRVPLARYNARETRQDSNEVLLVILALVILSALALVVLALV